MEILEKVKKYCNNLLLDIKAIKKDNIKEFISRRYKIVISLILFIFLIGGYTVGKINTSKSYVITELEVSLKEGKARKLASIVRINGEKVKASNLEPLIKYYEDSTSKVDGLIKDIKENGKAENLVLVENEGLFNNSYYFELNTYNLKINSNFEDGVFDLNGRDKINSGATFRGIVPGLYNIEGTLETEYGDIKTEKEILIMKDEVITVNFNAINVTISSDHSDAKVFVNEKDINTKVEDFKDFGPIPSDETVSIHIEKEFPWGKISSEKVKVNDKPDIMLTLDLRNDNLWEEIDGKVNSFYSSVFEALNEEDKDKITNSTIEVKNKIFDILEKKYFIFKNKYLIKNMNIVKEQSNFTYKDNEYRGTVVVEVNYDISKSFLGLNKTNDTKMFFTKMIYKDNEWIVEDVENFNL